MFKTIIAVLSLLPVIVAAETLKIDDAWARATIPGTENGAAYATLENLNDAPVEITRISSDVTKVAEIHRHTMSGDVMKMEEVKSLSIAPGETIKFQPGGYHFMLFGLKSPLEAKESFSLTLHFESGSKQTIQFLVKK
ncbi:copper chaperone PCu(A)C [Idiomarina sp. M1R2S28]|uniref:Copper chaperone PCu(A)C n=1 Tax=Idiomarina rhizosphaerae TaxID=2961572 RepID=A0A9X2FWW5_9GAMM|nr:copper chaperone PCu(A)C [Idiomarina rhizosphaerae]MCP1339455.1 copper chaperone PCu(A)C [Idiomarina rhizosphaerae]